MNSTIILPAVSIIRRAARSSLVLAIGIVILAPMVAHPDEKVAATHVIRTTVQIRNGTRRGSGTILSSVAGRTLILTAAHVVSDPSELQVELHRFNFGGSTTGLTQGGGWPRLAPATVVATDTAADVAILKISGMVALPHVARFVLDAKEPAKGEIVTSVGIDRTLFLRRWQSTAEGTAIVDINRGGGPRRFILTTRYPDHGRSGGGLYRGDGVVIGVCVGQLSIKPGQPKVGLFASVESIRRLLEENGLDKAVDSKSSAPFEGQRRRKVR